MLINIDDVSIYNESETYEALAKYLIKEAEMLLYNDNIILESDEIDTSVDETKPSFLSKAKAILKRIWNAIKNFFKSIKNRISKLGSNKDKANKVAEKLSKNLDELDKNNVPLDVDKSKNVNEYFVTEANNNNNNNRNNRQNQQQYVPQQPYIDPNIALHNAAQSLKMNASGQLYKIRFKSGKYAPHVNYRVFSEAMNYIMKAFDEVVDITDSINNGSDINESRMMNLKNKIDKSIDIINNKSQAFVSMNDITDKKGNTQGSFDKKRDKVNVRDFGKYYEKVIDKMEEVFVTLNKNYAVKFNIFERLINEYVSKVDTVKNISSDANTRNSLGITSAILKGCIDSSKSLLGMISNIQTVLNNVQVAINYDVKVLSSVNNYADDILSHFRKIKYVAGETRRAMNNVSLS